MGRPAEAVEAADVVIVGAGPAGCAAAILLAREGFRPLVLDRATFPRDKVCGDGLAPRTVAMLRRLGLEGQLQELGHRPVREYRITSSWGDPVRAGLPAFGKGPDYTYVVPRRELDALLVRAARDAGAEVREGVRVLRAVPGQEGRPAVEARSAEGQSMKLSARVLIAADGSRGSFSRTVLPSERLEPYAVAIRAYMEGVEGLDGALNFFLDRRLLPGYGWIFPASRPGGPCNVGLGMKLSTYRAGKEKLTNLFEWFLSPASTAWPYLRNARLVAPPAPFPLLVDFPRGRRRQGNILFAGDAANLIDPLSGEGIAYALESGAAAGLAAARALRSGRLADLASYDAAVWRNLSLEFLGAYLLREVLAYPWGNGLLMRLLRRDEGLARGGMGVLANAIPATWLLRPVVWKRVLAPARVLHTLGARHPARP